MDQDDKGCLLALVIPAVVLSVIGLIISLVKGDAGEVIMLSIPLGMELIIGLFYLLMRAITQRPVIWLSEQARKTQARRALILGPAVTIVLIVLAAATGWSKNQYIMAGFGLLAMPFIGAALFSNLKSGAKAAVIAIAVAAALLVVFSIGDLSDPRTVTIINGIRSTDASENLTNKFLLLAISGFFYYWAGTLGSGAVLWVCAPND